MATGKIHTEFITEWAEQLKQDIRNHLKYNGTHVPKGETIYLEFNPVENVCIVQRGDFIYRIPRGQMDRAVINKEMQLRRDLTYEEIYQLAKIESQYIDYEEINNLPDTNLCNPSGTAKL
jgi:hypothetical protein